MKCVLRRCRKDFCDRKLNKNTIQKLISKINVMAHNVTALSTGGKLFISQFFPLFHTLCCARKRAELYDMIRNDIYDTKRYDMI